jgi:hypothetical protein
MVRWEPIFRLPERCFGALIFRDSLAYKTQYRELSSGRSLIMLTFEKQAEDGF